MLYIGLINDFDSVKHMTETCMVNVPCEVNIMNLYSEKSEFQNAITIESLLI